MADPMRYVPRFLYWPARAAIFVLGLVAITCGVIIYQLLPPVWGEPFHASMERLFDRMDGWR